MKIISVCLIIQLFACDTGVWMPWKATHFERQAVIVNNTGTPIQARFVYNNSYETQCCSNKKKIPNHKDFNARILISNFSKHMWSYTYWDSIQTYEEIYRFPDIYPIPFETDTLFVNYMNKDYLILWHMDTTELNKVYSGGSSCGWKISSGSILSDTIILSNDTGGLIFRFD